MSVQPILCYPHPVLKKVSHAVEAIDDEILGLIDDLLEGAAIMREGCMSVPDYTGDVERATGITVRFQDGEGATREINATGFEAVAIQHEMDHLDGILFLDRIVSLKTGLFRRKNYR